MISDGGFYFGKGGDAHYNSQIEALQAFVLLSYQNQVGQSCASEVTFVKTSSSLRVPPREGTSPPPHSQASPSG